ncbi:MAG: hypothetical protein ABJB03_05710 [Rhodoglobus sp.]
MSENAGLIAEQEAFNELGMSLHRLLSDGDERIEYLATVLSPVTYERMRAYNPSGRFESPGGRFNSVDYPYAVSKALRALRAASYRDGVGTWFSARLQVTAAGAATAEYNYDDEPEWDAPVDSIAYVTDQEKFPRDEDKQPDWLKRKLAEGGERIAARSK